GDSGFAGSAVSDQSQVHERNLSAAKVTVVEAPHSKRTAAGAGGRRSSPAVEQCCRPYGLGRSGKMATEVTPADRAKFSLKLAFSRRPGRSFDRVANVAHLMA